MDPKTSRVALTQIAILEQAIEETPARSAADVSKGHAIGMLAPRLHAMRARGYTWRDIAAWLTEHGFAVTPAALQRSLRSAKVAQRERPTATGRRAASLAGTRAPAGPATSHTIDAKPASASTAPRTAPAAAVPTAETPARPAIASRPPPIAIRPDTKNI